MTVTVRDVEPSDADAVADLHVRAWQVAYRGVVPDNVLDHPDHERARHEGWRYRLEHGPPPTGDTQNRIFVGQRRERVVGFGHVGRETEAHDHERGEVYGLYVHPVAWGTGVADALMAACLAELRTRFASAVLWVLRDNPRARRFYERTGWTLALGPGGTPIEEPWTGPAMPNSPSLPEPLPVVRYSIELT